MDFEICVIFVLAYLLSLTRSQTRVHFHYITPNQQYRRFYTIPGNRWMSEIMDTSYLGPYPPSGTPTLNLVSEYPLQYSSPYGNSATGIDFDSNKIYTRPPELKYRPKLYSPYPKFYSSYKYYPHSFPDFSHRIYFPKKIYFEEYPHLKALLKYQKVRLRNDLPPFKLGSLRMDSPYCRP